MTNVLSLKLATTQQTYYRRFNNLNSKNQRSINKILKHKSGDKLNNLHVSL